MSPRVDFLVRKSSVLNFFFSLNQKKFIFPLKKKEGKCHIVVCYVGGLDEPLNPLPVFVFNITSKKIICFLTKS